MGTRKLTGLITTSFGGSMKMDGGGFTGIWKNRNEKYEPFYMGMSINTKNRVVVVETFNPDQDVARKNSQERSQGRPFEVFNMHDKHLKERITDWLVLDGHMTMDAAKIQAKDILEQLSEQLENLDDVSQN